jgi:hypothetical protein
MSMFRHHGHTTADGGIQPNPGQPTVAPELNASAGMTAVIILACVLAIVRGQRRTERGST